MDALVKARLEQYRNYSLIGDVTKIANIDALTSVDSAFPDLFGRDGGDEIAAEKLLYVGKRRDGYLFFGWKQQEGAEVRVLAGCQNVTLTEARNYWSRNNHGRHGEVKPFLDEIEAWANGGAPVRAKTQDRVDTALVREFLGEVLFSQFCRWNTYGRATPSLIQGENIERIRT